MPGHNLMKHVFVTLARGCGAIALTVLAFTARAGEPDVHWAFVTPHQPNLSAVEKPSWVKNPIDHFILAKLEAESLSPASEADPLTLARRLSFDLTGLPPSPEELDAFVNDSSDDAYEAYVDRLLASPHFGEKQALAWLDLARYADTDGYEFDQERPNMWRYRDWVVSALNRDMPYDRFLTLQIAGDEVAPDDPEAIVATGFNRLYPDMVDLNDQALRRQNALNDITETTASVFLGLTMGCARCHDHKFDPIKQRDFYALQAFFTPAEFRDDLVIADASQREEYEKARRSWEDEIARLRSEIIKIERPVRETIAAGRPRELSEDAVRAFETAPESRSPDEIRLVYEATERDGRIARGQVEQKLGDDVRPLWSEAKKQLAMFLKSPLPALPQARGLQERSSTTAPTFLLRRGDFASKGDEVVPGFPDVILDGSPPTIVPGEHSTGRRAALAKWLTRPDHPLTPRVIVNRLWQGHFGRGIVGTPSDFGLMGDDPTHLDLLDWLAREMIEKGWSLKAMHRLMVTSATYRQSTRGEARTLAADPENWLHGRHARARLSGEALRDALLAVSGTLNPEIGGPCVFPDLPRELTQLSNKGAAWPVSPRVEDRNRRSLYVFLRRNLRYPLFEAFDKPDTNTSCARRPVTTIAPQALSLLNGKLSSDSARSLAERVRKEAGDRPDDQVVRAYRLALGRSPDSHERTFATEFLSDSPLADLCLALMNLNEFLYID